MVITISKELDLKIKKINNMQIGGKPRKVKLTVDLTKYDSRCVEGSTGTTIPNYRVGIWGDWDTFVAVRFDNGAVLDILYKSLEFIDKK